MVQKVNNGLKLSQWSKMVHNGPNWSKMVHNGPKWSKKVQNGSNWSKCLKWSKMIHNGPKWSKIVKIIQNFKNGQNGPIWSNIDQYDPTLSKMVLHSPKLYKMVQNVKNGSKWSTVFKKCQNGLIRYEIVQNN